MELIEVIGNQNCRVRFKENSYELKEGIKTKIPKELAEELTNPKRTNFPIRLENKPLKVVNISKIKKTDKEED